MKVRRIVYGGALIGHVTYNEDPPKEIFVLRGNSVAEVTVPVIVVDQCRGMFPSERRHAYSLRTSQGNRRGMVKDFRFLSWLKMTF